MERALDSPYMSCTHMHVLYLPRIQNLALKHTHHLVANEAIVLAATPALLPPMPRNRFRFRRRLNHIDKYISNGSGKGSFLIYKRKYY